MRKLGFDPLCALAWMGVAVFEVIFFWTFFTGILPLLREWGGAFLSMVSGW
jgi:hypothetical protein